MLKNFKTKNRSNNKAFKQLKNKHLVCKYSFNMFAKTYGKIHDTRIWSCHTAARTYLGENLNLFGVSSLLQKYINGMHL